MLVFFVIINIAVLSQLESVQSKRHGRIVNGDLADPGQVPYQIYLLKNGDTVCGGSILNENFVLTAAHCVPGATPDMLEVTAGTVDLDSSQSDVSKYKVSNILVHEEYEEDNTWNNDIALLEVDPPFEFSQNIAPASLPEKDEEYKDNSTAVVSGFGRTESSGYTSSKLMKTDVFIVNQEYCQNIHTVDIVRPTNICTSNWSEQRGFCKGDSGGPLSINQTVIGIVSWSTNGGCAPAELPQVYTRVSSYVDWISERINQ